MKTLCERCMTVCRFQGQKNFSMETCRYFHQKAQTVGDKLRAMSDGELAAVIVKAYNGGDPYFLWCDRKGGCRRSRTFWGRTMTWTGSRC